MPSELSAAAVPQCARVLVIFLATLLASANTCRCSLNETDLRIESTTMMTATTIGTVSTPTEVNFVDTLKEWIANAIDQSSPTLARKLLMADVSSECSLGLLKLVRGIKNLEPWAIRLIDSSGKYPTGALQVTRADLGAFDECLETTVRDDQGYVSARGQYCSLLFNAKNNTDAENYFIPAVEMSHPRIRKFRQHFYDPRFPAFRWGICTLDFCNEQELQKLVTAVIPPTLDLKVSGCVSMESSSMTTGQKAIIACLATIAFMIVVGTGLEIYTSPKETKCQQNAVIRVSTSFSLLANTRSMLNVTKDKKSDTYRFQFFHGMRFLSIVWIVIGHCYGNSSDVFSRFVNNVIFGERWDCMVVSAGFISVDTFFFLSAFLLTFAVSKQKKSGAVVFFVAVIRRLIRTSVPMFFMLMCMYLLPLIVSGPEAPEFFSKLYQEVNNNWWSLLAQIRNYFYEDNIVPLLPHLWYLSVDFQFFLVTLPILLVCKRRPLHAVAVFAFLSLLGCSVATWQVANSEKTPFIVVIVESISIFFETAYGYYFYPFYHAICYFTGCITFLALGWLKDKKMSPIFQVVAWCFAIACGLCCIFVKILWYQERNPTSEFGKLSAAFFDRVMWSIFLVWVTVTCATGRGGFLCKFLSWSAFVPLSRLAFGVYLIHVPFLQILVHTARERIFFSHFTLVSLVFTTLVWSFLLSYIMFVFCEAPTARLDKLIFEGRVRNNPKPAVESTAEMATNGFAAEKQNDITFVSSDVSNILVARSNGTCNRNGFHKDNNHAGSYRL